MARMIQDLLDTSHLESGRVELDLERVDLLELLSRTIEHLATPADRERIRLDGSACPPVMADPERLERVAMNLLSNALKYSGPEMPVSVRLSCGDAEAIISVTDQGIGIAEEDLPHLFEKYYRAQDQASTEGLGLGLYISRLIIEAHGGRLWAVSKLGKGSTFCISLPTLPE